ncbi:MAG: ribonuclease P protein component [Desulfobacteraceae bacterium]|nr:ribonuclease P protein component [Desulfobacteraceae bacterium]
MPSLALPKSSLLRQPWEYRRVYAQGLRLRGDHFSLIFLANQVGEHRLGISVHGVKSAVRRNRLKRIVREFYRHHRSFIDWCGIVAIPPGTGMDVVFAIRSGFAPNSPQEIEQVVRQVMSKRPHPPQPPRKGGGRNDNAERKKS